MSDKEYEPVYIIDGALGEVCFLKPSNLKGEGGGGKVSEVMELTPASSFLSVGYSSVANPPLGSLTPNKFSVSGRSGTLVSLLFSLTKMVPYEAFVTMGIFWDNTEDIPSVVYVRATHPDGTTNTLKLTNVGDNSYESQAVSDSNYVFIAKEGINKIQLSLDPFPD